MKYKTNISGASSADERIFGADRPQKKEILSHQKKIQKYKAEDVLWEIEARRTFTEKHFHMADGTDIAVAYNYPVHYKNRSGRFEDIDNRLALYNEDGSLSDAPATVQDAGTDFKIDRRVYKNFAGIADVQLALSGGAERLASISYGGYTVSLTPHDPADTVMGKAGADGGQNRARQRAQRAGKIRHKKPAYDERSFEAKIIPQNLTSTVVYDNIFANTDLEYVVCESSLKENILITGPLPEYMYSFILETGGLEPKMLDDGGIELKDKDGQTIFVIPAGCMFDATGKGSTAVGYELDRLGKGKYLLKVTGDAAWINAEGRAFPVTIDPPVHVQGNYNIETSTLSEYYPNSAGGQLATESLGYNASTGKNYRMLVRVNTLPSLPDNSYVVNSGIYLYSASYSDSGMSSLRVQAQVLLSNSPAGSNWCQQHSWNDCPPLGSVIDWADVSNSRQFFGWNVTREAIKWYKDPSANYGICLKASKEGSMTSGSYANVGLASSSTANSGARPYFIVQYRNCAGIEGYYTYQSHAIGRAGTGYIGDYSGQLTLIKNDLSSASAINPAGISHVYNSMYSAGEYSSYINGAGGKYAEMKLGRGWMLDAQQIITEFDNGYLLYADGDGTIHYFYRDGDVYKDEDGLGLTIAVSGGDYILRDKKDNISYFTSGLLNYHKNANGNMIFYIRNSNGQIGSVTRLNSDRRAKAIATLNYDANGYLTSIVDEADNTTTYSYDASGRLTCITHSDGTSVSYSYDENSKLSCAMDNETGYSMSYEYNAGTGKIAKFYEQSFNSLDQTQTLGAAVQADEAYNGIQTYRHCGPGRVLGDGDDIISHYVLDYFGRTTSSYTTNADMSKIYGASCSKYSANTGTSATNNRVLVSSATGAQSINLLADAGVEEQAATNSGTAPWSFSGGGVAEICTNIKRTGFKSLLLAREQADADSVISQTVSGLTPGSWYVLSAYVNTGAVTSFGSSGKVFIRAIGAQTVDGVGLNWINDGWERIYAVAQASSGGAITLRAVASGLAGAVYFDDFQLEKSLFDSSGSPGPASLVADGAMSRQNVWASTHGSSLSYSTDPVFGTVAKLQGSAFDSIDVYQDIQINQPGTQTYLLSGWAKASSVPLGGSEEARKHDLWAEVYYEGESAAESHSESFNVDNENWQYLCLPIVPKCPEKTVSRMRVLFSFSRNPNVALYTNIALSRQDAQSYKYNADGELVSVTSSENEQQSFGYSGADLISQVTQGSGSYTYEYDSKHNMTKASNDGVSMSVSLDARGNTIGTVLSAQGTAEKISSSAVYSANGDLVYSQTDARGNMLRYAYDSAINKQMAQPTSVTDALGTTRSSLYDGENGRILKTEIEGIVQLDYTYSAGQLGSIQRTGGDKTQTYTLSYDAHGKMTGTAVGNRALASYSYGANNGPLQSMRYGNGFSVNYSYDALERISALYYNGSTSPAARYAYAASGSLGRVQDDLANRSYSYNYDALGRLIFMTEQAGSSGVQRMRAGYDTSNRLVSTEYALSPALDGVFGEAKAYGYTYNEADGSLSSMTLPENGSLAYTYDGLKRLTARQLKQGENEVVKRSYRYLPGAGENETTLMVSKLTNTRGVDVYSDFSYEYDAAGNILSISSVRKRKEKAPGGTRVISSQCETSYVYDQQGQLLKEYSYSVDPDNNDRDAYGLRYSYDAAGNLLSWGNGEAPFVLGYGDEAWPDLLTSFHGKPISYDAIGNPTKWHNGTDFTWINGRRLAGAVNSATGLNASYAYNVDGLRMAKTVNGVEHKYIWQGGRLVSEAYGGRELEFFYDEGGNPCALRYRSGAGAEPVVYYYVTNLQGDVLSLVDGEGFSAAEYYYNAWGLPMGSTGAMADINPLRYRGYYYDTELGMYYLKSRYYDPFVCRFINADTKLSTGQDFSGNNMFAYCGNNPVARVDSEGRLWVTLGK